MAGPSTTTTSTPSGFQPGVRPWRRARAACAAQPGFSESVQLNATGKLAISCRPYENDGRSAPCIHEDFFNFPAGFEGMGVAEGGLLVRGSLPKAFAAYNRQFAAGLPLYAPQQCGRDDVCVVASRVHDCGCAP